MPFKRYVYESDSGVSFYLRMDSDQATIAGAVDGTPDVEAHVRVSNTPAKFGITPRHLIASRLAGTAPNQYSKSTRVPICTPAALAAIAGNSDITINGVAYKVQRKVAEVRR
jgi:hypothetical protein